MRSQFSQVKESVAFLRDKVTIQPQIGLVLGTGLGRLADRIQDAAVIPYQEIPHFPVSTVESHRGQLMFGSLAGFGGTGGILLQHGGRCHRDLWP